MLEIIIGGNQKLGNFKTALLTYFAYYKYQLGYTIISNYHLKFPHHYINSHAQLLKVLEEIKEKDRLNGTQSKIYFAFDEIWAYLDARLSGSGENIKWSQFFMLHTRKVDTEVCGTAQDLSLPDKRYRVIVDKVFIPKIELYYSTKNKALYRGLKEEKGDIPILVSVKCFNKDEVGNPHQYKTVTIIPDEKILSLYDTNEVIRPEIAKKEKKKREID